MKYRADIDALRAIAVISVIFYHLKIFNFTGGFVGVDIFFVISGYVIAKSLEEDLREGRFSVWRFYNKRIRRIFPALFATLLVTWVAAYIILLPNFFEKFSESFLASATFVSNIYFWREWGYFSPDAMTKPLLHTWSLSVEEQYYIFAPLFTWLIYGFFNRNWLATLAPILLISLGLSIYGSHAAPTANFFMLPTRAWELLLGALLAHRSPPPLRSRWLAESLGVIALGFIGYAVFAFSEATPFPGASALLPCLGAALLIYLGQSPAPILITRLLSNKPMVGTGRISYSLYLVHWPLIVFSYFILLGAPRPAEALGLLVIMFILAFLSWRYIEQPVRHIRVESGGNRFILGGLAMIVLFALAGTAGIAGKGFPSRLPDYKFVDIPDHIDDKRGICFLEDNLDIKKWNAPACTLTKGRAGRTLLWGDSFAAHYVTGILHNKNASTVIQYTGAGCPPVLGYDAFNAEACRNFNANALNIIRDQKIDTVILAGRWANLKKQERAKLQATLATLDNMNVKVILIGQSPEFPLDVHVIGYYKDKNRRAPLDQAQISFAANLNDELSAMAGKNIFIDPMKALCHGVLCPFRDKNVYLFTDSEHFSGEGSIRAVRLYFPVTGR